MPLYSTSISDRKRRKPHFYDSRLFIYIFRFFSLASGEFWTFLLLFSALCPFSPALFHIFLWLPENFGLFPAFSVLYVHSHRLCSVLPSGFRMILDFFTLFLCFMSIFSCSAPYFPLASGCFWTFSCFFCALCPFSPAWLRISLWLPDDFGLFPYFSLFYVHMEEYRSLRTEKCCTEADKKVSDHTLFVPKTAFPTAISKTGRM